MKKFKFNKISIVILAIVFMLSLGGIVGAYTNPATVTLGTAGNFAVLAGSGITDTTPSIIVGDAGSYPTFTNGLPNVEVTGTNYTASNATVSAAKVALKAAYDNVFARSPDSTYPPVQDLGGLTLGPGIYNDSSSFAITGTLTLDGGNNPNSIFIFQAGSTLTTATSSIVSLINGAQACNVYWQVGSDATLGTTSNFSGTIMAKTSITDNNGSTVNGRLLADADNDTTGAVTLHGTHVTVPTCVPSLLLQKTIAGGGGPDLSSAWTLTATGASGSPTNLSGITGAAGANSDLAFPAATFKADTYTLAETGPTTNYTATYSCSTVNNGVTTTTTSSSIALVAGDKATCTITNTYIPPVVRHSSSGSMPRVVVAPIFEPSITILSTPVVAPIIPKLPKTGFPTATTLGQQVKTIESNLKKGSNGGNVTTLQQFLISENKGGKAIALKDSGSDGKFGPITEAALAEWQTANVLIGDGIFGQKTRDYLSAHY